MSQDPVSPPRSRRSQAPRTGLPGPLQLRGPAGRSRRSPARREEPASGRSPLGSGDRRVPAVGSPALSQPPRHAWTDSPHLPLVRGAGSHLRPPGPSAAPAPEREVGDPGEAVLPWPRRSGFPGRRRARPASCAPPRVRPLACAALPRAPCAPPPLPRWGRRRSRQRPCSPVPAVRGASDLSRRRPQRLGPAATGGHTPAKRTPQGFPRFQNKIPAPEFSISPSVTPAPAIPSEAPSCPLRRGQAFRTGELGILKPSPFSGKPNFPERDMFLGAPTI